MNKLVLIFYLFGLVILSKAQEESKFEFWVSSVNKSLWQRTTYQVTQNGIVVKKGPYDLIYFKKNYKKDTIVFFEKLAPDQQKKVRLIGTSISKEKFKSEYDNLCIMDGVIMHFQFEWGKLKKETTVSNYYLANLQQIVNFINEEMPPNYRLVYDKIELEKEMKACPPNMVVH